jgi:hypothetical protein
VPFAVVLAFAWFVGGAAAQQDPLKSADCGRALAALESARADPAAGTAAVEARRAAATRACLGGTGAAERPPPTARAPVVVPPPVIAMPEAARPRPPVVPRPPAPPPFITACDAGGCWDSNGTRLNRAGPQLIGPTGACTVVGQAVRCP